MENHIARRRFKEELTEKELKHMVTCRFCREELIRQVEENEMLTAPKMLKSSVLEQSRRLDIQLIAGTNQISKQLQLLYFSLKVGAAILCALTMLTVAPGFSRQFEHEIQDKRENAATLERSDYEWNYYEKVESFTARLGGLSNSDMEVLKYDKKER